MSAYVLESSNLDWTEADRLAALQGFEILDTEPEAAFDSLTKVAAHVCDAPIALVSLVDERRQWFKCEVGLGGVRETRREFAICAHAILQSGLFVVPDTTKDPRFASNPLVTGDPHLRFYAGAPLITDEGLPLGTLCVLDNEPRPEGLTHAQAEALLALAHAVMSQIKLRQASKVTAASERKFRTIAEAMPQMVWSTRPDGYHDYYNQRWYEFTGVPYGSSDGEEWNGMFHPDDQDRAWANWRHSLATGELYEIEYRLRHHSGEYRWTLGRALPVRNDKGEIERWFGTCTDIHDWRTTVNESENRYRALIEATATIVWRANSDGAIIDASAEWETITDQSPEAFKGFGWLNAVHPDDCERVISHWQNVLASRQPGTNEFRVYDASGEYRWFATKTVPILNDDDAVQEWVGTITDVHEQKSATERLRVSEERYRALTEASAAVVWRASSDGAVLEGRGWETFCGHRPEEFRGYGWLDNVHPDDREGVISIWQEAVTSRQPCANEYRIRRLDGEYRWSLTRAVPLIDSDGKVQEWVGTITDIHEQKVAAERIRISEGRYRALIETNSSVVWLAKADGLMKDDLGWSEASGQEAEEYAGDGWLDAVHPEDRDRVRTDWKQAVSAGTPWEREFRVQHKDGSYRWVAAKGVPLKDANGVVQEWVGTQADIHERRQAEVELWRAANYDALTGIPNRVLFQNRLEQALAAAKQNGTTVSLLMVDLDEFKDVNDSFGHDAGDALLKETAARLSALVRGCDTIARLGGDEFAVLMEGPSNLEHAATFAEGVAKKLRLPISYAGQMIASRASIGIAAFPNHDAEPDELMKDADMALYRAKAEGRNRVVTYSPEMRVATELRIALRREMRKAISRDQIRPYYQPKVSLSTGEIVGFEALARWQHPTRGLLTPGVFGSIFDDPELAAMVGKRLIGKVVSDMRHWLNSGLNFGCVAINLSHVEFIQPRLVDDILRVFELAKVPLQCFEIEITEKVLLDVQPDAISSALEKFRARGIRIALDDFGTGYASLTHLKQFPVDHIKVDRSFVRNIEENPDDEAIVTAVVSLGRSLNLQVTAEGVETTGQAQRLREMGCGSAQGYLYAKPMAGLDVPELLSSWNARLIPAKRLLLVER
jgi:diguanylate cyclase (GGDEF)-like protein/PAS domain S-box-containing protein